MATAAKKSASRSSPGGAAGTPRSRSAAAPAAQLTPPSSGETGGRGGGGGGREATEQRRSTSPGLLSRVQEKRELAALNDRLANYIETVRRLEAENSRLSRIVESQETTVRTDLSGIKGLYEDELAAARKLLDEVSGDKAKLLVEVGRLKSELGDIKEKLRLKEAEANDVRGQLRASDALLKELQPKLVDSEARRALVEAEHEKLKKAYNILTKNHGILKRQLEEETIARVDLQNQCQSLREELLFVKQVHDQVLNESITRTRVVVDEADDRLKVEYDNQLRDALLEMREELNEQQRVVREETEAVMQRRLEELSRVRNVDGSPYAELRAAKAELDALKSHLSQRDGEIAMYEAQVRNLENQIQRERDAHQGEVDSLKAELRHLRASLDEQLQEFKDLMDVKIRLDAEISAYFKLLESEEARMNSLVDQRSPNRKSPGEAKKRKLEDVSFTSNSAFPSSFTKPDAVTTSHAQDVITIDESSYDGSFVKLLNTSDDKNVTLSDWQLKQVVNSIETAYKFPRGFELKAKQHVTVWGKASGRRSLSSADLQMKSQNWVTGDEVLTELLNKTGEKMASLETKWSSHTPSRSVLTDSSTPGKAEQPKSASRWNWLPFSSVFTK